MSWPFDFFANWNSTLMCIPAGWRFGGWQRRRHTNTSLSVCHREASTRSLFAARNKRFARIKDMLNTFSHFERVYSICQRGNERPLSWDYHIHGWMLCTSVNARYIWHTVFATFALALSFDSSMAWVSVSVEADSGTAHSSFNPMTLWRADDCAVHTVRMQFSFGRLCFFALYASLRPTMLTPQTKRSWMGST